MVISTLSFAQILYSIIHLKISMDVERIKGDLKKPPNWNVLLSSLFKTGWVKLGWAFFANPVFDSAHSQKSKLGTGTGTQIWIESDCGNFQWAIFWAHE